MLRSTLVPLDGSQVAERALAYATALSVSTAARLILMRAISESDTKRVAADTCSILPMSSAHGVLCARQ
jgi:hypothetical protein